MQEPRRIKLLTKDDVYKRTGWFSKDCQTLIDNLREFGMGVIDINDAIMINCRLDREEDDLR